MRGAPHVGFSATMRKISSRTSVDSCFPPPCFLTFEIKLPVQVKPGSMPADHSCGSDHQQRLFPVGSKPACQHPEELVKAVAFWSGPPTLQYSQLLARCQIFQK